MGNDSPPHLSLNLQLNLQIRISKHKSRSEMGLLNTLQEGGPQEQGLRVPGVRARVPPPDRLEAA